MGSLPKNLSLLEDFITTVNEPPGIIAISETKSKEAIYTNIFFPEKIGTETTPNWPPMDDHQYQNCHP